jgi:hypothetical protein
MMGEMPMTPPIFIVSDELYVLPSKADAETWLEPVDVAPGEHGYDAEGRLLHVVVRGHVKHGWFGSVDQSGARVELVLAEEIPHHREELRAVLAEWLARAEAASAKEELAAATLEELVARAAPYAPAPQEPHKQLTPRQFVLLSIGWLLAFFFFLVVRRWLTRR